ncbi:MAG TPA: cytochrome b/b6 domain-containing protein [Gallionella sp.]|nr:cytochrome b/b6 domain-containing protein [Gallionella sp.]
MTQRILVWDVPTRVFHWLQALAFGGAYLLAFSERFRDYHDTFGYILLGLLVFRLLWGFVGTGYARFSSFLFNPRETVAYMRSMFKGKPGHYLGHNPVGSLSVWLLMGLGLFICVTGAMSLQDNASDQVIYLHGLATKFMLGVIFLHLAGVLLSSILHRENLVRSMVTGYKSARTGEGIRHAYPWVGMLMVLAVVIFWFTYAHKPLG